MAEHKRVRKLAKMELETRDRANLTNLMIKVRLGNGVRVHLKGLNFCFASINFTFRQTKCLFISNNDLLKTVIMQFSLVC